LGQALGLCDRPQSIGEEIANSVSHGMGLLGALAAFPFLVIAATQRGDASAIVGASVFATTLVLLHCGTNPLLSFRLAPVRHCGRRVSRDRSLAVRRLSDGGVPPRTSLTSA
jgi:hypothetical protein